MNKTICDKSVKKLKKKRIGHIIKSDSNTIISLVKFLDQSVQTFNINETLSTKLPNNLLSHLIFILTEKIQNCYTNSSYSNDFKSLGFRWQKYCRDRHIVWQLWAFPVLQATHTFRAIVFVVFRFRDGVKYFHRKPVSHHELLVLYPRRRGQDVNHWSRSDS